MTKKKKIILISIATGVCLLVISVSLGLYFYLAQQPSMKASSIRPRKVPRVITIKSDKEDTQEEQQEEIGPEKIVFVSRRDGNNGIYIMNPDGTEQTRLTEHLNPDVGPELSPDRNRIVFTRFHDNHKGSIYIMNTDGSEEMKIAEGMEPSWSPDGSKIVFFSGYSDDKVKVINSDGSDERTIATGWTPKWRFPSEQIIYVTESTTRGKSNLESSDLNGNVQQFSVERTNSRFFEGYDISSDGNSLVYGDLLNYRSLDDQGKTSLVLLDLESGNTEILVSYEKESMGGLGSPLFSHDGRWISFYLTMIQPGFHLFDMESKESQTMSVLGNSSWSPDSSRFLAISEGNIYLHTINGGKTQLTDSGKDSQPHWR